MNTIFKYLKVLGTSLLIILGLTIIISILNYFNILSGNFLNIIRLIIPIISLFYAGYEIGKTAVKKGYLEGLKVGLIYLVIVGIINLILHNFTWLSLLYHILLIGITMLGSMIGINRKKG